MKSTKRFAPIRREPGAKGAQNKVAAQRATSFPQSSSGSQDEADLDDIVFEQEPDLPDLRPAAESVSSPRIGQRGTRGAGRVSRETQYLAKNLHRTLDILCRDGILEEQDWLPVLEGLARIAGGE